MAMKTNVVAGIVAAAFCGAPAIAADMPVKAPPAAAAPYDPWTGCYIGGNLGYGWAYKHGEFVSDGGVAIVPPSDLGKTNVNGLAYGGQLGCDYHFASTSWVVGVRALWDGSNMKGSSPNDYSPTQFDKFKIRSFATAVVEFGYLLNPTVELYGLAGLAWVRDHFDWSTNAVGTFGTSNWNRTGYDIGVGVKWILAPHWDFFVEYDHMDFGTKKNTSITGVGIDAGSTFGIDFKQRIDKILVGVDYRFGGDPWGKAPVVAKY
jgi:outer membrane immunogenic protein